MKKDSKFVEKVKERIEKNKSIDDEAHKARITALRLKKRLSIIQIRVIVASIIYSSVLMVFLKVNSYT